jgi:lipopolysaccharide assembly protein A
MSDVAHTKPSARRGHGLGPRHWLSIVLVALAVIFVAQNRDRHPISLLWVTVLAPTWLVLTVIFVVGLLAGLLLRRRRR